MAKQKIQNEGGRYSLKGSCLWGILLFSFLIVIDLLTKAAAEVGGPQVRNRGTIGGNICAASPAADIALPLLCNGAVTGGAARSCFGRSSGRRGGRPDSRKSPSGRRRRAQDNGDPARRGGSCSSPVRRVVWRHEGRRSEGRSSECFRRKTCLCFSRHTETRRERGSVSSPYPHPLPRRRRIADPASDSCGFGDRNISIRSGECLSGRVG